MTFGGMGIRLKTLCNITREATVRCHSADSRVRQRSLASLAHANVRTMGDESARWIVMVQGMAVRLGKNLEFFAVSKGMLDSHSDPARVLGEDVFCTGEFVLAAVELDREPGVNVRIVLGHTLLAMIDVCRATFWNHRRPSGLLEQFVIVGATSDSRRDVDNELVPGRCNGGLP
jgi:hypothetical protein